MNTFTVDVMTVDVSSGGVMFLGKQASSKCSTEIQRVQGHKKIGSQVHLQKGYESGSTLLHKLSWQVFSSQKVKDFASLPGKQKVRLRRFLIL